MRKHIYILCFVVLFQLFESSLLLAQHFPNHQYSKTLLEREKQIVYSFTTSGAFLDLNKDSTFLFGMCPNDTICNCLCIKGRWKQLSYESPKKKNFFQKIFLKSKYNYDSINIKLIEENRTEVKKDPLYMITWGHFYKTFNDTFTIYYNSNSEISIGFFRFSYLSYIKPVKPFNETKKVWYGIFPDVALENDFLEKKYNIKFYQPSSNKEGFKSIKELGEKTIHNLNNDWNRARVGYNLNNFTLHYYYVANFKVCSCFENN